MEFVYFNRIIFFHKHCFVIYFALVNLPHFLTLNPFFFHICVFLLVCNVLLDSYLQFYDLLFNDKVWFGINSYGSVYVDFTLILTRLTVRISSPDISLCACKVKEHPELSKKSFASTIIYHWKLVGLKEK